MIPLTNRQLATIFGSANGYFERSLLPPKIPGQFSDGFAKNPPKEGPKIDPILHTKGIILNARGCSSFSGTISATIVLIIPTVLLSTSCQRGE